MIQLVSLLLHAYVAVRLLPALPASPWLAIVVLLALSISLWLMPMGIGFGTRFWTGRRGAAHPLIFLGWLGMGLFSSLLVLNLLRDLALLSAWILRGVIAINIDMLALQRDSALLVVVLAALVSVVGLIGARRTAAVVKVDVPITGLPAALDGFTIAQLSDIHVGPTIRADYLRRIVAATNACKPDMVAITGDLVDGSVAELSAEVAPLVDLQSRHGTFFVTGNHEYYSGAAAWVAELTRLGLTVLANRHVVLAHGGAHLVIAGVNDFGAGHFDPAQRSDPKQAMANSPADVGINILLAHQPRSAPAAAAAGFDLQLSGHTHGGQFLPWNFFVRLQQPFVAGLDRLQSMWVYTSRGTGYWGPPKRFGAPSEITLLRLTVG